MTEDFKNRATAHQLVNWLPVSALAHENLTPRQMILVWYGKSAVMDAHRVRDLFKSGTTNITHYAIITSPEGVAV